MFADSTSYLIDERWVLAQPASINKLYTYTAKNNPKNYFTGNYGLLHYVLFAYELFGMHQTIIFTFEYFLSSASSALHNTLQITNYISFYKLTNRRKANSYIYLIVMKIAHLK